MPSSRSAERPLSCPRCARIYPLSERFCEDCGMPLVYTGAEPTTAISEKRERARKIKPQYARGEPVKVGFARNQAEAELIQGMLLEEGIPSFARRTRGFDVPDFLAAGPRDILVPESGAEAARVALAETGSETAEPGAPQASAPAGPSPGRLAFWVIAGVAASGALVWVLYQLRF